MLKRATFVLLMLFCVSVFAQDVVIRENGTVEYPPANWEVAVIPPGYNTAPVSFKNWLGRNKETGRYPLFDWYCANAYTPEYDGRGLGFGGSSQEPSLGFGGGRVTRTEHPCEYDY